jgi:anti-anti-sigma factor
MSPIQDLHSTAEFEMPFTIQPRDAKISRMKMRHEQNESGIGTIFLSGRMDILGVQKIELRFTTLTATQRKSIIVDLSEVELLVSVGLGLLIRNANTLKAHGKIMVLLKPQPRVERVIEIAGLQDLLPIEHDPAEAQKRIQTNGI